MIHPHGRWLRLIIGLFALAALAAVSTRSEGVAAGAGAMPWSAPTAIAVGLAQAGRPALAYTSGSVEHAVWESNGNVFYAQRPAGGVWSSATQVAAGGEPALVVGEHDVLHLLFSNQFMGNYDIYYVYRDSAGWSLPINVSNTSGVSQQPALTRSADGKLHAAWSDNTSGDWMIYHGVWDGKFWSSHPVASARGQSSAIAGAANGRIFVGWQTQSPSNTNPQGVWAIFLTELQGQNWSMPTNISSRLDLNAMGVKLVTTADGQAHLVWVDESRRVRYAYGQGANWSAPKTVSDDGTEARGPDLLVQDGQALHISWDEGAVARVVSVQAGATTWPKAEVAAMQLASLRHVTLAASPRGDLSVGWVQSDPLETGVYESRRSMMFPWRLWLPMSIRYTSHGYKLRFFA